MSRQYLFFLEKGYIFHLFLYNPQQTSENMINYARIVLHVGKVEIFDPIQMKRTSLFLSFSTEILRNCAKKKKKKKIIQVVHAAAKCMIHNAIVDIYGFRHVSSLRLPSLAKIMLYIPLGISSYGQTNMQNHKRKFKLTKHLN